LLTNAPGRVFVRSYYRTSPPIAAFIARHDAARLVTRLALTPVIFAVAYPSATALGLILSTGGFWWWRRRRNTVSTVAHSIPNTRCKRRAQVMRMS
jgi:LPXTG-motif cell wall-anchored protein